MDAFCVVKRVSTHHFWARISKNIGDNSTPSWWLEAGWRWVNVGERSSTTLFLDYEFDEFIIVRVARVIAQMLR